MMLMISWLGLLTFFDYSHDLLVFVRRQHADERHHSHHRGRPAPGKSRGFGFRHVIVHNHHHVLWIAGNPFFLDITHTLSVLVLLLLRSNKGRSRLLGVGCHT